MNHHTRPLSIRSFILPSIALLISFATPSFSETQPDFLDMIKKNCVPHAYEQSPELYIVYQKDVLTSSSKTATFACSHGFPWEEDTRIPLMICGQGIKKYNTTDAPASLEDITPTLAHLFGVAGPEESNGKILNDALVQSKSVHPLNKKRQPKAAFVFTLDQCRADYFTNPMINPALNFTRFWAFKRGTTYTHARLSYAGSRTAVSHSVIGTGATPGIHGIVGNNIKAGNTFPLALNDQPRHSMNMDNLLTPTLADVMDLAFDNMSRIISMSPYGRAALGMGGHGALFSDQSDRDIIIKLASDTGLPYTNGDYFTLPGYLVMADDNPIRIDQWLSTYYGIDLGKTAWTEKTVITDKGPFAIKNFDTIKGPQGFFPDGTAFAFDHPTATTSVTPPDSHYQLWNESEAYPSNSYFEATMNTPFYQLWAVDMLLKTIENEGVGLDCIPDLVYYNFKCLDKVGHKYGVNSPELYTYLYYVDYCIRKIVHFLDNCIGPDQYTLVICADHGAHNAYDDRILYNRDLFNAIENKFGENVILNDPDNGDSFDDMIYLDTDILSQGGYSQEDVAVFIEETFADHVYDVYTKDEVFKQGR